MAFFSLTVRHFFYWPERIELDGIKVIVRKSPLSRTLRRRLMRGLYETAEREMVRIFVKPGDQILELGASIGILTCFLLRAAGSRGRVVSLEADATLGQYFENQLHVNGFRAHLIHALCCPIWKQPVPEKLRTQVFLPSKNSLAGRMGKSEARHVAVPWVTAEEACHETGLEPTVLVADIEGTEAVWAEQSPQFPESLRTIIVELHPHLIGIETAGKVVEAVLKEGYHVRGLRNNVVTFQKS